MTKSFVPLFNPRNDIWSEHFVFTDELEIAGISPVGRTTVQVLSMNHALQLIVRRAAAREGLIRGLTSGRPKS